MTLEPEIGPDQKVDSNDELGQIEAFDPPPGVSEPDPYVDDDNYDESLSDLDPDEQGGDLPLPEE